MGWAKMRKVGLFEAKRKLSELIERAANGEKIGITKRGKLAAVIGPAEPVDIAEAFARMEALRKRSKKPENVRVRGLVEDGRR